MPKRVSALLVRFRDGLCRECLILWSGRRPEEVDNTLGDLMRAVRLISEERSCPACHRPTMVVRFAAAE